MGRAGRGCDDAVVEADLPQGTLTLFFSDVEGSTRLLSRLGERYAELLSAQRTILREAFARSRGREMGTEGDSFFVVFESVGDAVEAAVASQRALAAHPWPGGEDVRVRMGLHTGEPVRHEDGYVGMDVHLAARIAASAHGGQVVVSDTTARLAGRVPAGVRVRGLGRHRLKDIPRPERLHQLVVDGLPADFPPLRTLGTPSSLPAPGMPIVGRDGEVDELTRLLRADGARLLTLTGAGGSGKTRLAIEVATALDGRFPDGIYFVPLESAETADVMWSTVAAVLGLPSEGRAPPTMLEHLSSREVLLVLDNLEQLPAACEVVGDMIAAAPGLRVLATSRSPLHLRDEVEHAVPPLQLPDPGDDLRAAARSGAVQLFVQRARLVRPGFALDDATTSDVVEICRRLDGLPLAIELAAARSKLLGPRALLARLGSTLELAARETGRPVRQQTLRATIAWSHDLLLPHLRTTFRRLGVLAGPADLGTVAAVTGSEDPLEEIALLADASLVSVREGGDGEPRIGLLQMVSEFATDLLVEAGELDEVRRAHAAHHLAVVERAAPALRSNGYLATKDLLELMLDDLRAALDWCFRPDAPDGPATAEDRSTGLRLCDELGWFWYACGYHAEGRRWLDRAVEATAHSPTGDHVRGLHVLAVLMLQHGENEAGRAVLESCLAHWRAEDDLSRVAIELNSLGVAHRNLGDRAAAREALGEAVALARRIDDRGRLATALSNLATVETDAGSPELAVGMLREVLQIDTELGDAWGQSVDHLNIAGALARSGRTDEAFGELLEHTQAAVALGDVDLTASVVEMFCILHAHRGDARRAALLLGAAQAIRAKAELPLPVPDQVLLDDALAPVRDVVDLREWDLLVEQGAGRGVADAVALAVADDYRR